MLEGYSVLNGLNTNFHANGIKPIVELGTNVKQVDNQVTAKPQDGRDSGFWSFLDDVTTTIYDGVGIFAQGWVSKELAGQGYYDPEVVNQSTTRGDTNDDPGNRTNTDKSFLENYQQEIIFGGVAIACLVGIVYVMRN